MSLGTRLGSQYSQYVSGLNIRFKRGNENSNNTYAGSPSIKSDVFELLSSATA